MDEEEEPNLDLFFKFLSFEVEALARSFQDFFACWETNIVGRLSLGLYCGALCGTRVG